MYATYTRTCNIINTRTCMRLVLEVENFPAVKIHFQTNYCRRHLSFGDDRLISTYNKLLRIWTHIKTCIKTIYVLIHKHYYSTEDKTLYTMMSSYTQEIIVGRAPLCVRNASFVCSTNCSCAQPNIMYICTYIRAKRYTLH